jgi:hypothetical protein
MSDDSHADRNARLKAAMRQKETDNLNKSPTQVPCSPSSQRNGTKMPTGHVDPGTGQKS